MSKKLKKKIEELCGLVGLDWEARQERAEQILRSNSWKQQLCNELQGLSFRDLEQHLQGVATERQKKEEGYERKLATYKSVRGNTAGSTPSVKTPVARPRTLQEILQQVYGPRVRPEGLTHEERQRLNLEVARSQDPDLLPDSIDVDDPPG